MLKNVLLTIAALVFINIGIVAQTVQFSFNENTQEIYRKNILKDFSPLPIAEATKIAIVERFIEFGKSRFKPGQIYSISEKQLYDEMKKLAEKSFTEFNDSTKYYWTIDRQMSNAHNLIKVVSLLEVNEYSIDQISVCVNEKLVKSFPDGIKHLARFERDKIYHDVTKLCIEEYGHNLNFQLSWDPLIVDQFKSTIHKQLKEELPTLSYVETIQLTDHIVAKIIKKYPAGIPSELAGSEKLLDEYAQIIIEWFNQKR